METTRIVEAWFNGTREAKTRSLFQYDYGQLLTFPDLTTPPAYQVQFCGLGDSTTVEAIGTAEGVLIPDAVLQSGKYINAYIFLHDGGDDGETRYNIIIPVNRRPGMSDITPTPEEQSEIDQLISALNEGVERSETAATAASTSASSASASAESAAGSAQTAVTAASTATDAASSAAASAESAALSASSASTSASSASASAESAAVSADRAEQAAANAGYMYFYIDENGDLIYQRTENTDVDFYLEDGDLYVGAIA